MREVTNGTEHPVVDVSNNNDTAAFIEILFGSEFGVATERGQIK